MSQERRKSRRNKGKLRIAYGKTEISTSDLTEDISVNGLFIRTPYTLELGAHLQIHIEFQTKNQKAPQQLTLSGAVTRVQNTGEVQGMGIEFTALNEDDRKQLELLLKNLPYLTSSQSS